jgi:Caspase domain
MTVRATDQWRVRLIGGLALLVVGVFGLAPGTAAAEHRVALVIGNAQYPEAPLNNPESDARLIASTLKRLGFEVTERENLGIMEFRRVLRDYVRRLQDENAAAVFYYAGHAVQIGGRNYLLPVDINLRDEDEVRDDAVEIGEQFVRRIEHARTHVRIVILDACRDDPYASSRARRGSTRTGGLAEMSASGELIAYSSAPGQVAEDGPPGTGSVYTRNLAKEMLAEDVQVEKMFKNVLVDVLRETHAQQVPWINSSLTVDFSFNPTPPGTTVTSSVRDQETEAPRPFDDAVKAAVAELLEPADPDLAVAASQGARSAPLVIDSLIDASTGFRTRATQVVEGELLRAVHARVPRLETTDFSPENLARRPLVLIGTVTPLDREGRTSGARYVYAIRLALLDLQRGIVISNAAARSRLEGVDATPTRFYGEMPAWAPDPSTEAYTRACNDAIAGAPIDATYRQGLEVSALVSSAIGEYEAGRLREALDAFTKARRQGGHPQLRIESGLYLAAARLDRVNDAQQAFARIVDLGLRRGCLQIAGHASKGDESASDCHRL